MLENNSLMLSHLNEDIIPHDNFTLRSESDREDTSYLGFKVTGKKSFKSKFEAKGLRQGKKAVIASNIKAKHIKIPSR